MMNPKTGEFEAIKTGLQMAEAKSKEWPIFEAGEEIEIKGHKFKLKHIDVKHHELVLVSTMLKRVR